MTQDIATVKNEKKKKEEEEERKRRKKRWKRAKGN